MVLSSAIGCATGVAEARCPVQQCQVGRQPPAEGVPRSSQQLLRHAKESAFCREGGSSGEMQDIWACQ